MGSCMQDFEDAGWVGGRVGDRGSWTRELRMQGVAQGSWHLVSDREGRVGVRDLGSGSGDGSADRESLGS